MVIATEEASMLHGARWGKTTLVAAMLGVFLLVGCVASALAGDRDHECRERIEKADAILRREIDRHGERSRQAERRRHELEETRERCRGDRDRDYNHDNH